MRILKLTLCFIGNLCKPNFLIRQKETCEQENIIIFLKVEFGFVSFMKLTSMKLDLKDFSNKKAQGATMW